MGLLELAHHSCQAASRNFGRGVRVQDLELGLRVKGCQRPTSPKPKEVRRAGVWNRV